MIRKAGGVGERVRLVSCSVGAKCEGYARELARELKVPVIAVVIGASEIITLVRGEFTSRFSQRIVTAAESPWEFYLTTGMFTAAALCLGVLGMMLRVRSRG